jgi:ligand-binding sensor domain-containing protein/two-component sensor histidine kinase
VKVLRFLLLFLLAGRAAEAQLPVPQPEAELPFTNYSSAQGLIHNRCMAVREDQLGYLWIATEMGICRYNGRTFRHFPCPGAAYRPVRNGVRSGNRVIFPINGFGAAAAIGSEVRFFHCENLRLGTVVGIAECNDTTFLLSDQSQGLVLLSGKIGTRLNVLPEDLPASRLLDMTRDREGNIWLGASNGLWLLPGGRPDRMVHLPFWDGIYVNSVRQDKAGLIYITSSKGLFRYPVFAGINTARLQALKPDFLLPVIGLDFPALYPETDGTIWIGSNPSGALRLNSNTGHYEAFTPRNGFASHTVWDITSDHEGNIWFATENGLSRLSRGDFMRYNFRYLSSELLKAACPVSDSELLIATDAPEHFLLRPDNTISRVYTPRQWAAYWPERIHRMSNGDLWITESMDRMPGQFHTNAYKMRGDKLLMQRSLKNYPGAPAALNFSRSRAPMSDGSEWFCAESGIYYFNGKSFQFIQVADASGGRYIPVSIASSGDSMLYVLRAKAGLYRYRIKYPDSLVTLQLKDVVLQNELKGKSFNSLMTDSRGWVWAGSSQDGMMIWSESTAPHARAISDSLSNTMITCMVEDASGTVWIGTARGLNRIRISPRGALDLDADVYGAEFCDRYVYFVKALREKLYVGTGGCLGIIDLNRSRSTRVPALPIYITGLQINGQERSASLQSRHRLDLSPEQNNMRIEFTGLSYRDERRLRYRYRLKGLDRDWSSPTPEFRVTYSKIPPGDYEFEVMAFAPDGLESAAPACFSFHIGQPFYTSWWFITLCLLFALMTAWSVYRYRINQFMKMQQMRQRISKDLHDDIGATVSSIGILAEMVKSGRVNEDRQKQLLETISEESRYVAQTLSDIVWTINPRNDSMDAIFARMQRYAAEMFEAKGIQYKIILPDALSDGAMDMQSRQHLYLIFKEAVNNLIKYSGATEAALILKANGRRLLMELRDNGRGFEADAAQHGNGIANMRKRAEEMLAKLEIKTAPGAGTVVTLDAPLQG